MQQGRRRGISHVASLTWPVSNCWEETLVSVCMQPFVTNLGIVVHHHEPECHVKKWNSVFKVKVTVWALSLIHISEPTRLA